MKIIYYSTTKFSTPSDRQRMAEFVSSIIERGRVCKLPYKPNEWDDFFWTLDSGNNWKIKFFENNPEYCEIVHRYDDQKTIYGLSIWIAYITGGYIYEEKK